MKTPILRSMIAASALLAGTSLAAAGVFSGPVSVPAEQPQVHQIGSDKTSPRAAGDMGTQPGLDQPAGAAPGGYDDEVGDAAMEGGEPAGDLTGDLANAGQLGGEVEATTDDGETITLSAGDRIIVLDEDDGIVSGSVAGEDDLAAGELDDPAGDDLAADDMGGEAPDAGGTAGMDADTEFETGATEGEAGGEFETGAVDTPPGGEFDDPEADITTGSIEGEEAGVEAELSASVEVEMDDGETVTLEAGQRIFVLEGAN